MDLYLFSGDFGSQTIYTRRQQRFRSDFFFMFSPSVFLSLSRSQIKSPYLNRCQVHCRLICHRGACFQSRSVKSHPIPMNYHLLHQNYQFLIKIILMLQVWLPLFHFFSRFSGFFLLRRFWVFQINHGTRFRMIHWWHFYLLLFSASWRKLDLPMKLIHWFYTVVLFAGWKRVKYTSVFLVFLKVDADHYHVWVLD